MHSDLGSLVGRLRAPGTGHIHQIGIVYAYFETTNALGFILEAVELP